MITSLSLRARLTFVILIPLLLLATLFGVWAYNDAQNRAAERFDRSLLSTALAITRDTAATGGDVPSPATRDLLRDTSGGAVFYHVYAPDGVFVTGYATPPVPPSTALTADGQTYFDAVYQGEPVRVLRFTQTLAIDGLNGPFTFSVWQNTNLRDGFVRDRTQPVFLIIASMITALALIVWFGVRLGLYPLIDLENAIARRSANDLSPIRRAIPVEVSGIVGRINSLLDELNRTLSAKDIFISDAAHQLRNPIAGVLALAESVRSAKTPDAVKSRSEDLIAATRDTATLANNLLTLERARATPRPETLQRFDATARLADIAGKFENARGPVTFTAQLPDTPVHLHGDPILFEQAVLNVLTNALTHGGPDLSSIALTAIQNPQDLVVTVADNGKGIDPTDHEQALARFSQIAPTSGSGLGLPIAQAITEGFDGSIELTQSPDTFQVAVRFKLASTTP